MIADSYADKQVESACLARTVAQRTCAKSDEIRRIITRHTTCSTLSFDQHGTVDDTRRSVSRFNDTLGKKGTFAHKFG